MMITSGGLRIAVPSDLASVTTINHDRECDPYSVGLTPKAIANIWSAVESYYKLGVHPALTLVIRRHGKIVISRGIGHARGDLPNEPYDLPLLAHADTPICLFSGSKAITAMLIHKLAEQGKLALDDLVTKYLPDYGAHGKGQTHIYDLLTHKAGLPMMPAEHTHPEVMFDFNEVVRVLCAAEPDHRPKSRQAYHAVTAGYLLGAIAEKASGQSLPELLKTLLADPLGCQSFSYGVPEAARASIALSHSTGPRNLLPLNFFIERMLGLPEPTITAAINTPEGLNAVVPAANIYASAEEACRFYQMLLDGGVWNGQRLFNADTVALATRRRALRFDGSANAPIRFSPAFMLGEKLWSLYGFNSAEAYGHLGFMNILCWADPARDISVAFLNTGKTLAPESFVAFANVSRVISQQCSRVR